MRQPGQRQVLIAGSVSSEGDFSSTVSLAARASLGEITSGAAQCDVAARGRSECRRFLHRRRSPRRRRKLRPSMSTMKSPFARPASVRWTLRENLSCGAREPIASRTANSSRSRDAQRRREREGARAADCDGVEVERNLHADHQRVIFCRIEELPAGGDK